MTQKFAVMKIDRDVEAILWQMGDVVADFEQLLKMTWTIGDRAQVQHRSIGLGLKKQ